MLDRRPFVTGVATLAIPPPVRGETGRVLRPEEFGARGDGVINEGPAFAALSKEVNRRGGGRFVLGAHRTCTLVLNGKVLPKQLMGGKPW